MKEIEITYKDLMTKLSPSLLHVGAVEGIDDIDLHLGLADSILNVEVETKKYSELTNKIIKEHAELDEQKQIKREKNPLLGNPVVWKSDTDESKAVKKLSDLDKKTCKIEVFEITRAHLKQFFKGVGANHIAGLSPMRESTETKDKK